MAATTADQSGRVVLIALDGSDQSTYAFETYLKSLKYPDDVVLLVTCKELSKVEKLKTEEETKKAMLKPYGDKLQEVGIKFKPLILVSQNPGYSIVNTAQAENAGLIVMGSRGHGKLRRTLVGSCSDYVINHTSAIPVVVCRQGS
ncbi:hypothetical protein BaRGS_00032740 [Batillaria attramentaria]|uniref:UspA domain-containing protein n=1 Tax=Batillaria attramentaria TaxID=370345 RepID=A0ABD0JLW9_9CAEN